MSGGEFDILSNAAAGMDAQRAALDLAARNVAAAQADGTSFERLIPRFAFAGRPDVAGDGDDGFSPPGEPEATDDDDAAALPIRYTGAATERESAPDAVVEMVAVLDAQRAYDANASVFDVGKRLAERTIDMGRLQ